ncbi:MAG: hypothetical protein OQJ98_00280 [Candidatus Pacebacteria bacterium]|nr:hypothetical protein [Candidatus Paceibacterota bacterium]
MHNNNAYNLMAQIVTESKSIYQMKEYYCNDAKEAAECKQVWEDLIRDKEEHIALLTGLLKKELNN